MRRLFIVFGIAAVSARAHAAPPGQTDSQTAPAAVSQINGRLVPIGEHDAYMLHPTKHVNISTNPFGLLFGFYAGDVEVAATDHLVVRGSAEYLDYELLGHTTGTSFSGSMPIYLSTAFRGPYIEPGYIYQQTMEGGWDFLGGHDTPAEPHTISGPMMLAGYHWTFDSGFNVAIALGVKDNLLKPMSSPGSSSRSDDTGASLTGYLRMGVAI